MNKSIAQATQNDKQISKSIISFFNRFHVSSALKSANAYKRREFILSSRIIKDAVLPLDSEERANVLILDDSTFERNRSKKAEPLAKVYDMDIL